MGGSSFWSWYRTPILWIGGGAKTKHTQIDKLLQNTIAKSITDVQVRPSLIIKQVNKPALGLQMARRPQRLNSDIPT